MSQTNWIKIELSKHFVVQKTGVDLDRNGKIEGPEVEDFDGI